MSEHADAEMPRYKSHKHVWALKIAGITFREVEDPDSVTGFGSAATVTPAEPGYGPFEVDSAYVRKHAPYPGGYYVQYADGYKSFSPADVFEEGYTRI